MEPTLSQIKEYVREKDIDVFKISDFDSTDEETNFLYGDSKSNVYFQYYLEHSVEIAEWLLQNTMEPITDSN